MQPNPNVSSPDPSATAGEVIAVDQIAMPAPLADSVAVSPVSETEVATVVTPADIQLANQTAVIAKYGRSNPIEA